MDISQLRAFVAVADQQNFGRAAEQLHITQPALTKRIRVLETTAGTSLFERGRSGTVLTASGEALLADARRIIMEADAWLIRARDVAKGVYGRIAVGFGLSTIEVAPRMIARFRLAHPYVDVSLNDFSSAEQLERLRDGRLDLGFVRFPVNDAALSSRVLAVDRLALASPIAIAEVPAGPNLADCNEAGFVMLSRSRGPGLRTQIDDWCHAVGFQPKVTQTADDIQTVLAVVAAGGGVSIVPHQAVHLMGSAVAIHPLDGTHAEWEIGAVWRSQTTNPALRSFLGMATP